MPERNDAVGGRMTSDFPPAGFEWTFICCGASVRCRAQRRDVPLARRMSAFTDKADLYSYETKMLQRGRTV